MISYAQNAEDVILARALASTSNGFYVDVGAASPNEATVTRHFYEAGWSGINIEPIPEWAAELRLVRARDHNLEVACAAADSEVMLYRVLDDPSLSTLDPDVAESHRLAGRDVQELRIPVRTLNRILAEIKPAVIDFLKIDVEGAELEVLSGIDLKRWRPRVIVVEATLPTTLVPNFEEFDAYLTAARYTFAATDGINRYYAREEEADTLLPRLVPANSTDDYVFVREYLLLDELSNLRSYIHHLENEISMWQDAEGHLEPEPEPEPEPEHRLHGAAKSVDSRIIAIDRIAVCSTPLSGGARVAAMLGQLLGVPTASADHPADISFGHLPDRCVLELTWGRTEKLRRTLLSHGFHVVTVRRHPIETLVAYLRLAQVDNATSRFLADQIGADTLLRDADPTSDAFLKWAIGPRAASLVGVSASWSADPAAFTLEYQAVLDDPARLLTEILLSMGIRPEKELDVTLFLGDRDISYIPGGWQRYVPRPAADRMLAALSPVALELRLADRPLAGEFPSAEDAVRRWQKLVRG